MSKIDTRFRCALSSAGDRGLIHLHRVGSDTHPFTSVPSGPGTYNVSIVSTQGTQSVDYVLGFTLTSNVPEPSSAMIVAARSSLLIRRRRNA